MVFLRIKGIGKKQYPIAIAVDGEDIDVSSRDRPPLDSRRSNQSHSIICAFDQSSGSKLLTCCGRPDREDRAQERWRRASTPFSS